MRLAFVIFAAVLLVSTAVIVISVLRPVPLLTPEPGASLPPATGSATMSPSDTGASEGTPAATPSAWTPALPDELGTSNLYLEYILDASGSMNDPLPDGSIKLEIARDLLSEHLQAFRPETNIGLRAYGHRVDYRQTAESCQDIELIAPVAQGQLETIVTWLNDFQAQGMTPLAQSIRLAMEDFVFEPGRINSIVMISDGEETCDGDPCGLVEELKAQGINFTIHVIGLDVDEAAREQLSCIAGAAGGTYHDARSAEDLDAVLGAIQYEVTKGEVVVPSGVQTSALLASATAVVPTHTTTSTSTPDQTSAVNATQSAKPTFTPVQESESELMIAFFSDRASPGYGEIFLMNPDGSDQVQLSTGLRVPEVSPGSGPGINSFGWSESTDQFLYSTPYGAELYTVNADGTGKTLLATLVGFFAISPNGQRVALQSLDFSYPVPPQIVVMSVDGTGYAQLTNDPAYQLGHPTWSPDGVRIAYSRLDAYWVMDAGGGESSPLVPSGMIPNLYECAWSPVGDLLACNTLVRTPALYVVDLATHVATKITDAGGWMPAWSLDSSQIAFHTDQLWVINPDGSGLTELTSDGRNCCPIWVSLP